MVINHICFDLDGTLVNSFPTIYKCTLRTLEHFNIEDTLEEKEFHGMIGYHFLDIFNKLKIKVTDVESFINTYKTFYFDYIEDSVLYPAVEDVLKILKEKGIKISLLTTKGQDQAEMLLEHFRLINYFDAVYGRRPGLSIKPDPEPLLKICSQLNVEPAASIMVGDSDLDIRCGRNAGTKTCAVTFGYRTAEVLKNEYPDFIIDSLSELPGLLNNKGVNEKKPH
jgi:HAD superfamily hydrolase (TIGR01549 family)